MVHAALLLLIFEVVRTDLVSTISLKRSTQNLQLSTSSPGDYPIFEGEERKWRGLAATSLNDPYRPFSAINCGTANRSFDHLVGDPLAYLLAPSQNIPFKLVRNV